MYVIINNTRMETITMDGNFPMAFIEEMLNKGDDVLVISTYSNTIKVPKYDDRDQEWRWTDYRIALGALKKKGEDYDITPQLTVKFK